MKRMKFHRFISQGQLTLGLLSILLGCILACSSGHRFVPPPPLPDDRQHIEEPKERDYNHVSDSFDKQFTKQIEQSFDLSRQLRHLFGKPKQAFNINAFDEVPNSSWFTNRNAMKKMTLDEIARGPDISDGPDQSGGWVITRAKAEGVTPGFTIKDIQGINYVIKFDPKGYPELATGAEVISTKLFYAAGYHVPENYIAIFHPDILKLGERVKFTDEKGKDRFMIENDLDDILNRIQKRSDGRIRALASKYVPGEMMGPFAYQGLRKDDPNDFIPHQHRRELRGLRAMAAWLNHTDIKSGNSYDSYITENGRSYIRHYLLDFGSTLGSAAHGPMEPHAGHENAIDPHEMAINILTLGLYVRPYEKLEGFKYPSIGLYESTLFDPGGFKHNIPNPAFENCTNRDGFWGAKLVMSFTDEQLETVVTQAQYSNPEAAAYLLRTLKERRDTTGRYWFNKVNPIDRFYLRSGTNNQQEMTFVDLAVETDLESKLGSRYRYGLKMNGKSVFESKDIGNTTIIKLPDKSEQRQILLDPVKDDSDDSQWEIKIQTWRDSNNKWGKWVKVYLNLNKTTGEYALLGMLRQE